MNYYPHHIGASWIACDPIKATTIPAKPGVYVVYFGNEVVYVGQSKDLRARMYSYKFRYGYAKNIITPWGDVQQSAGLSVKYKVSKRLGDWAMWEIRLIHRLKPRFNCVYTKIVRAA